MFNLKQIANLSTEITEIKDFIQAQNEISNNKLENIKDVSSNSNNIGIYILTAIIIAGICYFGFNYFNNDSAAAAMIISEQVAEQNKTLANNINSRTLNAIRNQTTNSLDERNILIDNIGDYCDWVITSEDIVKELSKSKYFVKVEDDTSNPKLVGMIKNINVFSTNEIDKNLILTGSIDSTTCICLDEIYLNKKSNIYDISVDYLFINKGIRKLILSFVSFKM